MDDNTQKPDNKDINPEPLATPPEPKTEFRSEPSSAPVVSDFKPFEPAIVQTNSANSFRAEPVISNSFEPTPKPEQQTPSVSSEPVVVTHKTPKRKKLLTALLLLLLVVAAGAAMWFVALNKDQKTQATTTVKDVQVLNYGSVEGPIGKSTVFPEAPAVSLQSTIDQQIYEGLVGYKSQKIVPLLASSWKNPDENTWVFTLRSNVTFQNGTKVDAAAVKASLDGLQNNENWSQYVSTIKSVDVVDATHVKIVTSQPDALLLNRLVSAFIYDTTDKSTNPSGTGAYTLDTAKSNDETVVVLEAYDEYYQGKPKTRNLIFTVYPDDDALIAAAKAKKVDVLDEVRNQKFADALKPAGFDQINSESPGSYSLQFNTLRTDSPVANLKVRQAVAYAMDRAALLKELASTNEPTRHMVPKSVLGYDASAQVPDYDLVKAKALQTEAGYANGAPITVAYIKGLQEEIPIVIKQLETAGFKVTAKPAASPDEMVSIIKSGEFDIVGFSTSTDYSDAGDYFTQTLSSTASNFPLYDIPEVDKMLAKSNEDFDATDRIKQLQEINKYAADNVLIVPLRNGVYSSFYRSDLTYRFDFNAVVPSTYFWNVGQKVTTKSD